MLQSNNHSPFFRTFLIHVLRIKSSVSTVELCRMLKTSFRNPTLLSELAVVFSIRNTKETILMVKDDSHLRHSTMLF